MSMSTFEHIIRSKFPHELIRFVHADGHHYAYLKGGIRLSSNDDCESIYAMRKGNNGVYGGRSGFCAPWHPAAEGLC